MFSDTVCKALHPVSGEWRDKQVIGETNQIALVSGNLLPLTALRLPFDC
jgi:hypothetical protein